MELMLKARNSTKTEWIIGGRPPSYVRLEEPTSLIAHALTLQAEKSDSAGFSRTGKMAFTRE